MTTLMRRVVAGMGANAFGQGISILTQLAALPLYLAIWDANRYGVWLMLTAIPSYFSMTDGGIINAARNEMTMSLGRGDISHANRVFQSALAFLLSISALVLLMFGIAVFATPVANMLKDDYAIVLFLLVAGIFMSFINGLSEAVFCSVGLYGLGTAMGHCIRLAEWGGGLIGLYFGGSFFDVAIGMFSMRAFGVLVSTVLSRQCAPVFVWGFGHASMEQFKITIQPALYFLIFPLSSALSIQGFTLLIGSMLGASSVTIFNTYRTLARVIVQATSILSFSVGPELSRLFGAGHYQQYSTLFRRSQMISVAMVLATSAVVVVIGPWILQLWTHGRIAYSPGLLWSMLLYATVVGFGHVPKILLMSINRHSVIALASIAVYAVSLALAYMLGGTINLIGTITVMTGGELVLLLLTVYLAEFEIRRSKQLPLAVF
ncbi:O-antigen/teichoic acid export membrane protein [Oxalobacteraceae bacterium GrIS 2.11]